MKSNHILYPIVVFWIIIGINLSLTAQNKDSDYCLEPVYHENCFIATKSIFDDLLYLKSRPFSREMMNQKYVLNLKKNTLYFFNVCQGTKPKAVVTIYDARTEELIVSTKNPKNGQLSRALNFYTKASGQYLISVDFKESNEPCIVVMMGMIRKNIDTYIKVPAEG